ncbi:MAG: transcriptional repressor [Deltaproteobacteria bacterium]|nr:transcriptional repressor [Deltaproteobacteria bacterium]
MMSKRQTQQLLAVFDVVNRAHDHPSVEQIHQRVRERMPRVSLGTVYRNLQKLASERRVSLVQIRNRPARYDAVVDAHDHFVCEHCHVVLDLAPSKARLDLQQLEHQGFAVRSHALTFYGQCPNCRGGRKGRQRNSQMTTAPA